MNLNISGPDEDMGEDWESILAELDATLAPGDDEVKQGEDEEEEGELALTQLRNCEFTIVFKKCFIGEGWILDRQGEGDQRFESPSIFSFAAFAT